MFANTIECHAVDKAVVVDVSDDAFLPNAVTGPAQSFHVGVIERILVRGCRGFHVGVLNARIDNLVFPVFVVVVLIELMCIVRRVAEDDEDRRGFLTLDAFRVLEVEEAKLGLCFFRSLERIYQAYAWERFIAPGLFPERVLNVYRSDVVRQ